MKPIDSKEIFQAYASGKNPEIDKESVPFLVGLRNALGQTLLHVTDDVEAVRFLLSVGLDPNALDNQGRTPLMRYRKESTNILLLEAGADVNALDPQGNQPLDYQAGALDGGLGYCSPHFGPMDVLLNAGAVPPSGRRAKAWLAHAHSQVSSALENMSYTDFQKWVEKAGNSGNE
jgi:hypothetical protein